MTSDIAVPLTAAGSGAAWALLAAWRARQGRVVFAVRALLGGAAAFGLAVAAYDLAAFLGASADWTRIARRDGQAFFLAGLVGLVEEGGKLAGLLLVLERGFRRREVLASAIGVAAGFSALEALLVLHGDGSVSALARAALGPVAHALLAVPLALGVVAARRVARRRWRALAPALLASATLHAASDLSLVLPWVGSAGYAAALVTPALVLFARVRTRK